MSTCSDRAWNGFVLYSHFNDHERASSKRAAAIASLFMGGVNNGGLNSFLTSTPDLDAEEVLHALLALGAGKAAHQLDAVLTGLGTRLPASTEEERWRLLDERWDGSLDDFDVLSADADDELMAVLEAHVAGNEAFYSSLD